MTDSFDQAVENLYQAFKTRFLNELQEGMIEEDPDWTEITTLNDTECRVFKNFETGEIVKLPFTTDGQS
jgi:hypothetical protein